MYHSSPSHPSWSYSQLSQPFCNHFRLLHRTIKFYLIFISVNKTFAGMLAENSKYTIDLISACVPPLNIKWDQIITKYETHFIPIYTANLFTHTNSLLTSKPTWGRWLIRTSHRYSPLFNVTTMEQLDCFNEAGLMSSKTLDRVIVLDSMNHFVASALP